LLVQSVLINHGASHGRYVFAGTCHAKMEA
jgi:hypothetical protein